MGGKLTGNGDEKATREARLAAQLRENLRKRKLQARALASGEPVTLPKRDVNG